MKLKTTVSSNCECGHEKRDHAIPPLGTQGYGACKVCLCNRYTKVTSAGLAAIGAVSH